MRLLISAGRFALDPKANPPRLKPIELGPNSRPLVSLGPHVRLRPDPRLPPFEAMLNMRVEIDTDQYHGLGGVIGGCSVFCTSNFCTSRALRRREPAIVAKVVGVMSDVPYFVLLSQPRLKGATRSRHESLANRSESGLMPHLLTEPGEIECPHCPGPNLGEIVLEP
jgi:hypothetical protein